LNKYIHSINRNQRFDALATPGVVLELLQYVYLLKISQSSALLKHNIPSILFALCLRHTHKYAKAIIDVPKAPL
jgi:hypothetical protein